MTLEVSVEVAEQASPVHLHPCPSPLEPLTVQDCTLAALQRTLVILPDLMSEGRTIMLPDGVGASAQAPAKHPHEHVCDRLSPQLESSWYKFPSAPHTN